MQHSTPQSRAAALNQTVMNVLMPMMPLLQQQGIAFDINKYLSVIAQYQDMPDLIEIVTVQEPPAPETSGGPGGGQEQPGMPGSTTRNYVRENVSTKTPDGQAASLVNNLMSGSGVGGEGNGMAAMGAGQ